MPKSYFTFDGLDSRDWNCYKTQPLNFPTPAKDFEEIEVPGRNGNIILDNGSYKNVEVIIDCYIDVDFIENFDKMRAYLMRDADYHRFEDSLYPDEYRLVSVRNVEAKVATPKKGTIEITLSCKPQRFLKSGEIVTYELSSDTAPSCIVAEGTMKDVMSAQYVSVMGLPTPNEVVTVLDVDGMYQETFIDDTYKIYAYYLKSDVGGRMVYGDSDKDPTSSAYTGGSSVHGLLSNEVWSYSLSERYIYFKTPLYWKIVNETQGIEVASLFTAQANVVSPTRFPAQPLIKIKMTGTAITGQAVAYIGGKVIRLDITPTIFKYGQLITVNEIYIDCETMDAYTLANDAVITLNEYVILPNESITIENDTVVMCNGFIDSLTITPRWWTL